MLCGNDYFIVCHALSLFQRENFKPCSALEKNFVRASTETVLSLLRTWWQISNTQNKNPQEGKNQARSLTQDLKSAVDACCTSQTGKSTTNAEWAKMLQFGKQFGQESSEMVLIQTHQDQGRSTTLFWKILWHFLVFSHQLVGADTTNEYKIKLSNFMLQQKFGLKVWFRGRPGISA